MTVRNINATNAKHRIDAPVGSKKQLWVSQSTSSLFVLMNDFISAVVLSGLNVMWF